MLFPPKRGVEGGSRRREVYTPNEGGRLPRPLNPVHAGVLPLHRERTVVADAIEGSDHRLEIHAPASDRSEVPARSEEHTSELQSRQYLVCRLLLEKKKKQPFLTSPSYSHST